MKAIRKSDGKIIDVEVSAWSGDCAIAYHTDLKYFYKPEDLDFNIPQETEQSDSFDWKSFRVEAAKDILCAMISTMHQLNSDEIDTAVGIADDLILRLKEKSQ